MPFPRGEEPSVDDLRATSELDVGGDEGGWGADDGSSGGDAGVPGGGELPGSGGTAGAPATEDRGSPDRRLHDLTQAVNLYREEAKTLKQERLVERQELAQLRQWQQEVQAAIRQQREEAQRAAAEAANADPEPDPVLEADKHAEWERRQEEKRFAEVRGELRMTKQQLAEQRQQVIATQLETQLDGFTNRFTQRKPDYPQAYEFLVTQLADHYRRLGHSDEAIFAEGGKLWQERDQFLRSMLEINPQGQFRWVADPAAALYEAAVRYGWTGAAPAAGTQPPAAGRRPAGPAQRRPSRAPVLANAAAAAAGAGGGAGSAGEPLTAERVLAMSPRDYAYLAHTRPDLVEQILRSVS